MAKSYPQDDIGKQVDDKRLSIVSAVIILTQFFRYYSM